MRRWPCVLSQGDFCFAARADHLDRVVDGQVLDPAVIAFVDPFLFMLQLPVLPLSFPVFHAPMPPSGQTSPPGAGNHLTKDIRRGIQEFFQFPLDFDAIVAYNISVIK